MSARILIVEDEQIVAADLRNKLRRLGYEVVGQVDSGPEAIRLAGELRPDLVLMDMRLQGAMDGREAAQQIQQTTGTRVVYVTANSDLFLGDPGQMVQPGLCVAKPFSVAQLKTIIEVALEMPQESGKNVPGDPRVH